VLVEIGKKAANLGFIAAAELVKNQCWRF